MQRVFVLDKNKNPLMPCSPARARRLLKKGKAYVFRYAPFTIIIKDRSGGDMQPLECKIDPGSRTTGITLVLHGKTKIQVIWAAHLEHRGQQITSSLISRRATRRSRRHRKTRYRKPRFLNRRRKKGWLAPSLRSRLQNVVTITLRLQKLAPISDIHMETVRFDTQKMQNPEISGKEYQQGTLAGYECREYILEKFNRTCAYCNARDVPLEIDHIVPKSRGGSDRVSNLTLACHNCNQQKGNTPITEFLKNAPETLKKIEKQSKAPLKDAAAVNTLRIATSEALQKLGLIVSCWSGGQTKYNRIQQGYVKEHFIDAACIGDTGKLVDIPDTLVPLTIRATGRGSRQACRVDRFGFPRTKAKSKKCVNGFQTGDLVSAKIPQGKKKGEYVGRVAIRTSGYFNITTATGTIQGIHVRYCQLLQKVDGYLYTQKKEQCFLPRLKSRVSAPKN